MPANRVLGSVPTLRPAPQMSYTDAKELAEYRASFGFLQGASSPLIDPDGGKAPDVVRASDRVVESIANAVSNELAWVVNDTLSTDYSKMLPVVETFDGKDWVLDEEVTAEWEKFARNEVIGHAAMRKELSHHLLGGGLSYLYLETTNNGPRVQLIPPTRLKGVRKAGALRTYVHVTDSEADDVEIDPEEVHQLWIAQPLSSLSGWKSPPGTARAQPVPQTWLMPLAGKFRTLRQLDRSLNSMAVNRFLHNGIMWLESSSGIARPNPMTPTGSMAGITPPPTSMASGPNPKGQQSQWKDAGDHGRMLSSEMPTDGKDALRLYMRVLERAYNEPDSAAARAPFPLMWHTEPKFIRPDMEFDKHRLLEAQAIEVAIARGCPLPFDWVLDSGAGSAHWSRKNMREETIEASISWAEQVDAVLSTSLFRLWLEAAGLDPEVWRLRSDPSRIQVKPDITEAVRYAHERGIVTDEGFLELNGVPEEYWTDGVKGGGNRSAVQPESQGQAPVDDSGTTEPKSSTVEEIVSRLQSTGLVPYESERFRF